MDNCIKEDLYALVIEIFHEIFHDHAILGILYLYSSNLTFMVKSLTITIKFPFGPMIIFKSALLYPIDMVVSKQIVEV